MRSKRLGATALLIAIPVLLGMGMIVSLRSESQRSDSRSEKPPPSRSLEPMVAPTAATASRVAESQSLASDPTINIDKKSIRGFVEDEDGRPVANATVFAQTSSSLPDALCYARVLEHASALFSESTNDTGLRIRKCLSGQDGAFEFDGSDFNCIRLVASARDYGIGCIDIHGIDCIAPLRIRLKKGVVLEGTVTGKDGVCLPRATIVIGFSDPKYPAKPQEFEMSSDECGKFCTDAIPCLVTFVAAWAPHYRGRTISEIDRDHSHVQVDLALEPMKVMHGRILSGTGRRLSLSEIPESWRVFASSEVPSEQRAGTGLIGSEGRVLRDAGEYEVDLASDPTYVSLWRERHLLAQASISSSCSDSDLIVEASPEDHSSDGNLDVSVSDNDGQVVTDYEIKIRLAPFQDVSSNSSLRSLHVTDALGAIAVKRLVPGQYDVSVYADGFVSKYSSCKITGAKDTSLSVCLNRVVRRVAGRITSECGQPLSGARVLLLMANGLPAVPYPDYVVTSNCDGTFEFPQVGPDSSTIVAEMSGVAPAAVQIHDDDAERIELRLATGMDVSFRLYAVDDEDIGMFQYKVSDELGRAVVDQARPGMEMIGMGNAFTLRLPSGRYTVQVRSASGWSGGTEFVADSRASVRIDMSQAPTLAGE